MHAALDSVYITYWSLLDPLCQSQSLPYLYGLTREGYRLGLITFEQPPWRMAPADVRGKQEELRARGIEWQPLSYHKRPAVVSTLFDIGVGSVAAATLARRSGASLVHGRSSVSCAVGAIAAKLAGTRFFADADGPLSQEKVDAGVWKEGSLGHRLTAWGERKAIESADVVAVLTDHRKQQVKPWSLGKPVHVLACAVDLKRFRRVAEQRQALRDELGLRGTVVVYAGKSGGWYDTDEMMAFLGAAKDVISPLTMLVLSREDPEVFSEPARSIGVPVVVRSASPAEMPSYLSSADVGLCFLRPFPSKLSCSPIKLGEYLACGLPVVSTSGCGDYDRLVSERRVGVVVPNSERDTYPKVARSLKGLLAEPGLDARCREAARASVGLDEVVNPRYSEIYRALAGPRTGTTSPSEP